MTSDSNDPEVLEPPNLKLVAQDKAKTKLHTEVMHLLSEYESKLESYYVSPSDTFSISEVVEDDKNKLRESLFESLSSVFFSSYTSFDQIDVTSFSVYRCLNARISRAIGMYQALARAHDDMRLVNQSLGDPAAIEMPSGDIQRVLSSLDEVDFVRTVGTSMGVNQSDLDRIVSLVVAREFGSGRNTPSSYTPAPDPVGRSRVERDD